MKVSKHEIRPRDVFRDCYVWIFASQGHLPRKLSSGIRANPECFNVFAVLIIEFIISQLGAISNSIIYRSEQLFLYNNIICMIITNCRIV